MIPAETNPQQCGFDRGFATSCLFVEPWAPTGRCEREGRNVLGRGPLPGAQRERCDMRKISWLLAAVGGVALVGVMAVQGVAAADHHGHGQGHGRGSSTVLRFSTMTPVTGPFVGAANPVNGVVGGGLPWMLTSGSGSLQRDGHLQVRVRGLVL